MINHCTLVSNAHTIRRRTAQRHELSDRVNKIHDPARLTPPEDYNLKCIFFGKKKLDLICVVSRSIIALCN